MKKSNEQIAIRASVITVVCDVFLLAFKLIGALIGNSAAMLADAVESMADMFTTGIVMIGVKLANRKEDKNHPYGHERFECVAAIVLSMVLFLTGAGIGWAGVSRIMAMEYGEAPIVPGLIALVAAVVTLAVKEGMYWFKRGVAKKINSDVLMADAWHHRSDALSSIGSFAGILGARLGFPILDSVAAILICLLILKSAFGIFRETVGKMTDKACGEEAENEMRQIILAQEQVLGIDMLKTRLFGDKIYVEVEISVDGLFVLHEAHEIAHRVHDAIESGFEKVKHCTVHVNPAGRER